MPRTKTEKASKRSQVQLRFNVRVIWDHKSRGTHAAGRPAGNTTWFNALSPSLSLSGGGIDPTGLLQGRKGAGLGRRQKKTGG